MLRGMSEQKPTRYIVRYDSGDGLPYFTNTGRLYPWSARQRDAATFGSPRAAKDACDVKGYFVPGHARVVRLVPKRKVVAP